MVALETTARLDRMAARLDMMGYKAKGPLGLASSFGKATVDDTNGNRDVLAVATTDNVDLEDEVVLPGGADPTYFAANKKVFVDHTYDTLSAVGVLRNLRAYKGPGGEDGWLARIHIVDSPDNPLPSHILALARAESIGTSIGFEALDYGRLTADESKRYPGAKSIVRRWKWLELSFTAMPCNVACQTRAARSDESRIKRAREVLTKGGASAAIFNLLHLPLPMLEIPAPMFEIA